MTLEFDQLMFNEANVNDVTSFVKDVTHDWTLAKYDRVCATRYTVEPDTHFPTMCTVRITFQAWKEREHGYGTKYEYTSYRAVDGSCSNRSFKKVDWTLGEIARD